MGSMVVGFSSAYTSPALVSMRDRNITSFDISDQEVSKCKWNFPIIFPNQPNFLSSPTKQKENKIDFLQLIFPFYDDFVLHQIMCAKMMIVTLSFNLFC